MSKMEKVRLKELTLVTLVVGIMFSGKFFLNFEIQFSNAHLKINV